MRIAPQQLARAAIFRDQTRAVIEEPRRRPALRDRQQPTVLAVLEPMARRLGPS
jgi:hypothetical protein